MRRAVCSGSFDPVTKGHLDIIERASRMFDEIIVCVFFNPTKDKALFTPEERVAMLKTATSHLPNVKVTSYSGLLNDGGNSPMGGMPSVPKDKLKDIHGFRVRIPAGPAPEEDERNPGDGLHHDEGRIFLHQFVRRAGNPDV